MIGRADIEGSKSDVAMNAWPPQAPAEARRRAEPRPRGRSRRGGPARAPGARAGTGGRTPPEPRPARRGRAGARRAPRGRPRRPPQLGRSTGRARLASRVAAAAGPPGARAPEGDPAPRRRGPRAGNRGPPPPHAPGEGDRGRGETRGGAGSGRGRARPGVPRAWGGGGASSSRGARPAPLRAPARPTQPLEPILIPKLRIRLADFPYLHCSNMPEAVHLGDLLRIWVRPGARFTPSPPDFQGPARAHRTPPEPRRFPRHGPLSRGEPIPGRPALHKEKRTLPGAPAGFSGIGCVTALDASRRPSPPLRIRGSEPDSLSIGRGQRRPSPVPSERRSPISQDRLTHVQLLFTWNPSPLRPSKFSFEYLLLPPRSAPAAAPPGPAP
ncbi:collagen alpha-1(I) chain-like [Sorex araneus]|uniref:collagen alpha-1(I) chain-like n=1 Tax=Sorex araneus TaxID=42254 RepID=UPI002433C35E|nr:collagen alpha-1(I) chain-like [Sorex araneus]